MGFASSYLNDRTLFPEFIKEAPDSNTGIIVVIPAYDEPDITCLLDSLALCDQPGCMAEVIIVINAPPDAPAECKANNKTSCSDIEKWKKHKDCFFRVYTILTCNTGIPGWGVGLARKTGMDEAVRRFSYVDRPEGVIVNLDADCRVDRNYFTSLYNEFYKHQARKACSVYFEHPVTGTDHPLINYKAVTLYELHLRYFYQGMLLTGFPNVFHTVGSAIAVKALPYIKAGGMNRRQAGEDFYFIQKMVASGGYFYLNSTTVYPSPRVSLRVPFGTGPVMAKVTAMECPAFLTYNIESFYELRSFFNLTGMFFNADEKELKACFRQAPAGIISFFDEDEALDKILEIRNNTSRFLSFQKRFFGWFNMFMAVKYLNHVHKSLFSKTDIVKAASILLGSLCTGFSVKDPSDLLRIYRSLEKG